MQNEQPKFTAPTIRASDLNKVADAAFGWIDVDGGDVEKSMWGTHISIPKPLTKIMVRVYAEVLGSGGSLGSGMSAGMSGNSCAGSAEYIRYRWVAQVPAQCGKWIDDPSGLSGSSIDEAPAYEWNNSLVADGSVQEIEPRFVWVMAGSAPKMIVEWRFHAGSSDEYIDIAIPDCIQLIDNSGSFGAGSVGGD